MHQTLNNIDLGSVQIVSLRQHQGHASDPKLHRAGVGAAGVGAAGAEAGSTGATTG